MTLIYKLDLDILKMYLPCKKEVLRSRLLKAGAQTGYSDRQTDRQADVTRCINTPHLQVVAYRKSFTYILYKVYNTPGNLLEILQSLVEFFWLSLCVCC